MAQATDYTLSNIGFSAFRTELNEILAAINTLNAGSSAPSSIAAGSLWLDTTSATTPTLKFYDGSDQISLCTFNYSANTVNWLDNSVSTDLVNDTSPQLGGMLDVNGNHIGDGTLELLKFSETGSAVNEFTIANAATGGSPTFSVTGGDTNVNLQLTAKGTGLVKITANSISGDIVPGKFEGTNFDDSILIGHSTTGTLSSASNNTGVGIGAMTALTSGNHNTAVGQDAGKVITTGIRNTYIGSNAGIVSVDGNQNTGVGRGALTANVSGDNSTAVGFESLDKATGHSNTAFGEGSGSEIVGGAYNLTLGRDSGNNITTGDGNVIIGSVDGDSATDDRQLKIAGYDGSTTTTWIDGDSTGNVTFPNSVIVTGDITLTGNDLGITSRYIFPL